MSDERPPTEQNLAAMLLTIGAVTLASMSVIILSLDGVIVPILVGAILTVSAISFGIVIVLDLLDAFDEAENETGSSETTDGSTLDEPPKANQPLAPLLNFDEELRTIHASFDEEVPPPVETFTDEYQTLKGADPSRRQTLASDLRASLNPLEVTVDEDTPAGDAVEDIGDRLFRYIRSDAGELVTMGESAFFLDGEARDIERIAGEKARLKTSVYNEGDEANIEVIVQFLSASGVQVRRESLPVGTVYPNQEKELDTHVYVPTNARSARFAAVEAAPGEPVLDL
jgi:hypothetical protein